MYDHYLEGGNVDRSANPTPGNKKGGLCNIVEKAMGSIAKSGSSPIVEVLSPAERPSKKGLIYAATPASIVLWTLPACIRYHTTGIYDRKRNTLWTCSNTGY